MASWIEKGHRGAGRSTAVACRDGRRQRDRGVRLLTSGGASVGVGEDDGNDYSEGSRETVQGGYKY